LKITFSNSDFLSALITIIPSPFLSDEKILIGFDFVPENNRGE